MLSNHYFYIFAIIVNKKKINIFIIKIDEENNHIKYERKKKKRI